MSRTTSPVIAGVRRPGRRAVATFGDAGSGAGTGPRSFARRASAMLLLAAAALSGAAAVAIGPVASGAGNDPVAAAVIGIEACCLPDGSCVGLPVGSDVCTGLLGGAPLGPGTSCLTNRCDGGCCFPETGDCIEGRGFGECADDGGVFGGFGSDCEPIFCGVPTGACCLPDGDCVGGLSENFCTITRGGSWSGAGTECRTTACCSGDVTGDGGVDFADVLAVLSDWGRCEPAIGCPADLVADGVVEFADLLLVLAGFDCP